jgi:glyoxylase-like metal-dependent hydrolase (beta-lactamase superfamily II)
MHIEPFFDKNTATFTYVVTDESTRRCAIIDSVLDYDADSATTSTTSADAVIAYIKQQQLAVEWILETHVHADHLTAAEYLKAQLGGQTGVGEHIKAVLAFWVPFFNTQQDTPLDGSQFDRLFADGDEFYIGTLQVNVIHTPGHTPACVSYVINDEAVFVGDALLMPYVGTARTDFPGGSARELYHSIQQLWALPDHVRVFSGHDYPLEGKPPTGESTISFQKKNNILINQTILEEDYVLSRQKRDQGKAVPRLLLPSAQINLRAGSFGHPDRHGVCYLNIPLNAINK